MAMTTYQVNMAKSSEAALRAQRERLEEEAEGKIGAARTEFGLEVEAAKKAREEANALYAKEHRGRKAIHNKLVLGVLVPGVVFCPDTGARLGQGGGFYDRFLARHPQALAVGLAFDAQCSPGAAALAQPHDRGMHALVSESAIRWFGRPGKGDHAAPCEADGA